MKSGDGNACELVINNARIFDGSALLQGLYNVGIASGRISSVSSSAIAGSRQSHGRVGSNCGPDRSAFFEQYE